MTRFSPGRTPLTSPGQFSLTESANSELSLNFCQVKNSEEKQNVCHLTICEFSFTPLYHICQPVLACLVIV